jgi:hypothetical protein
MLVIAITTVRAIQQNMCLLKSKIRNGTEIRASHGELVGMEIDDSQLDMLTTAGAVPNV